MLKQSTIDKIRKNAANGQYTKIGKYLYTCHYMVRYNPDDYTAIVRCPIDDFGRVWIDCDGNKHDAWERVIQ